MSDKKSSDILVKKKGRRRKIDVQAELNRKLTWSRFGGNFESMTPEEIIKYGDIYIAEGKKLKIELLESVEKWKAEERLFAITGKKDKPEKTHFVIAGGNYSCRFLMPWVVKYIRTEYYFLPIKLILIEFSKFEDYPEDVDLILYGLYEDEKFINIPNTVNTDVFLEDEVHLITSKETYAQFGNDSKIVLENVPLIFARHVADAKNFERIENPPYYKLFSKYIKKETRLFVDTYFVAYEFMLGGRGVLQGFSSMPDKRDVVFLTQEPLTTIRRYFVYNKDSEFTEGMVRKIMVNKDKIFPKNEKELMRVLEEGFELC